MRQYYFMGILIVAATSFEIKPSLRVLKKLNADVAITGVGCPVSVYSITKAIERYRPSVIIQAGIAGGFDRAMPLGTVLSVLQDEFSDIGVTENGQWRSVFDMGFMKAGTQPFKEGVLKNPNKILLKHCSLERVKAVTVNEITTNKARINLLKARGIVLESMEGAALHYVALMEKIPFLQIRSVSNYAGERDKAKWNFKDAINNLNEKLVRVVEEVNSE
ncbi:MAG: futalosine hydrolase [Niabella sp.]